MCYEGGVNRLLRAHKRPGIQILIKKLFLAGRAVY